MIKLLIFTLLLSIVTIQPVFAETTQLKQWIAPPECVTEGNILTPEECDQLLHPTPPASSPPAEAPATDTASQKPTAPFWQVSSIFFPSTVSGPSSVNESGIRIVDRSETDTPTTEYLITSFIVLLLILIGTGLLIFTSRRKATNLPK